MKLYSFFRSSASYRVRIALNVKRIPYEQVPVHFRRNGGEHRRAEFLALNPQGLLPVLEHDGEHLTQSLAIVEYLDAVQPEPRLIPSDPLARARVQSLAQLIACEIHPLDNLRVLNYLREELAASEDQVGAWYRHWIATSFEPLEAMLQRTSRGPYCCGESVTLADVCLVPQVYNARRFGCDLAPYPTLARISADLERQPAFAAAAPERQPDAE